MVKIEGLSLALGIMVLLLLEIVERIGINTNHWAINLLVISIFSFVIVMETRVVIRNFKK